MKRKAQAPPLPLSKRVKRDFSGIFDDVASEVCFADIKKLDWKAETRLEYVCGGVNGIQDVKGGGKRIILKSIDKSDSLEIQFVGRAFKGLIEASDDRTFVLKNVHHLMIALRGAEVLPMAFNKQIPNCIKLNDGVMLKILKSKYPGQEGKVLDTWREDEENLFNSPSSSSETAMETLPTPAPSSPAPSRPPSPDNAMDIDTGVNKKTLAKQRRAKTYNEKKALRQITPVAATTACQQQPVPPRSTTKPLMASQKQNEPVPPIISPPIQPTCVLDKPALDLRNGLHASKTRYIPLSMVDPSRQRFDVVAVVCSNNSPSQMNSGDWQITLELTDPSYYSANGARLHPPLKVNCFKPQKHWLPQPAPGDVVILRDLKFWQRHPIPVGYKDRLSWALYRPGDSSLFPHDASRSSDRSTFYKPIQEELDYCKQLGEWWTTREAQETANLGTICDIGAIPNQRQGTSYARKSARQHRLISDASPECEPQGYFDATVELLNKYDAFDNTNLYVTDYTINAQLCPLDTKRSSWCPEGLEDRVLCIETSYQANELARTMEVGKIYALENLRMKFSSSGYLEGRMQDKKIRVLDEEDESVHMKNFLVRRDSWRKEFEARKGRGARAEPKTGRREPQATKSEPRTSMCNLSDAAWDRLFSCVVEVISLDVKERTLYVSDYTHSKILNSATEVGGMAGYVLPIRLNEDGHLDDAQGLNTGDFCLVENVKLKNNQAGNARGYLRKVDKCPISKVSPDGGYKVNVDKLIARKEKRSNGKENLKAKVVPAKPVKVEKPAPETTSKSTPATTSKPSPAVPSPAPILPPDASTYIETDIQNLMHHAPCPGKYRVTARLILISHKLREAVLSVCDNCSNPIPSNRKACVACNDDRHEFVRRMFRFGLLLGYEGNNQLVVFLDGESPILGGLRCVDLREDGDAYEAFRGRMRPMMGDRWGSGSGEEEDAPTGTYFVKVRCNVSGERKFFLQAFVPL